MCSKTKDNENENCVQLKSEFKREQIYLEKDFVFSYFDVLCLLDYRDMWRMDNRNRHRSERKVKKGWSLKLSRAV